MTAPTSSPYAAAAESPLSPPAYSEWADRRFRRLLLVQMAYGYAFSALLIVPKFATSALLATAGEVGVLAASSGVAVTIAGLMLGRFLDGGGVRTAILGGSLVLGASTLAFAAVTEIGLVAYALRGLHGVASALIMGGAAGYVALLVPAARHGRAFAVASTAALMMNAVGSSVTESVAAAFGWQTAFELAGAVALAGAAAATKLPELDSARPVSTRPVGAARPDWDQYAILAGAAGVGIGFGMISTFSQPYVLLLGGTNVSSLFVGFTITALFVRIGLSSYIDRVSRKGAALLALSLYALATAWAAALEPGGLLVLGLAFGAAHGLAWPSLSALVVERSGSREAPATLSRLYAFFSAGTLLSVWTGGKLVEATGYVPGFVTAGIAVALCAAAVATVPPRAAGS
jgi:MFS family permease